MGGTGVEEEGCGWGKGEDGDNRVEEGGGAGRAEEED